VSPDGIAARTGGKAQTECHDSQCTTSISHDAVHKRILSHRQSGERSRARHGGTARRSPSSQEPVRWAPWTRRSLREQPQDRWSALRSPMSPLAGSRRVVPRSDDDDLGRHRASVNVTDWSSSGLKPPPSRLVGKRKVEPRFCQSAPNAMSTREATRQSRLRHDSDLLP
jgi:hypothetical protein